jgi:hypothetical protein
MVKSLRFRVLTICKHIALLGLLLTVATTVKAQSLLLPGDVMIASVNTSADNFDLVPLVDIDAGTELSITGSSWMDSSQSFFTIQFKKSINAGTSVRISGQETDFFVLNNELIIPFEHGHIFLVQLDQGVERYISGVEWGVASGEIELPPQISTENQTFTRLGIAPNHQYYLKNGASGTPKMLRSMLADAANWRKGNFPFQPFGTSFQMLTGPVVVFNEQVSTIEEGEEIQLNVAVYEHDGSRLTVNAVFHEGHSTADTNDVHIAGRHTFNFTGLIGDAVYTIALPTVDDERYEGKEAIFFELSNLSNGVFGDFVNHAAFIYENDSPNLLLSDVNLTPTLTNSSITIQNNEEVYVDITDWTLSINVSEFAFVNVIDLAPFEKRVITLTELSKIGEKRKTINMNKKVEVELLDARNASIVRTELTPLLANVKREVKTEVNPSDISTSELKEVGTSLALSTETNSEPKERATSKENAEEQKSRKGWVAQKYTSALLEQPEQSVTVWQEQSAQFKPIDLLYPDSLIHQTVLFYQEVSEEMHSPLEDSLFDSDWIDNSESAINSIPNESLIWTLSATDSDQNGILNGAEGFNFLTNGAQPLPVNALIAEIERQIPEITLHRELFLWNEFSQNWNDVTVLTTQDTVAANQSFWVKSDSLLAFTQIEIRPNEWMFGSLSSENIEEIIPDFYAELSLKTENVIQKIRIEWFEEETEQRHEKLNPALNKELLIPGEDYFSFGVLSNQQWVKQATIHFDVQERLVYPLAFISSVSATHEISISDWNLSGNWQFYIEDALSDAIYELSLNEPFTFEYFKDQVAQAAMESNESVFEVESLPTIEERYRLVILPPGLTEEEREEPEEIALNQNYPNPFNPVTTISFYLPETDDVRLSVFNVVGQPVAVLKEGTLSSGEHRFDWDATGFPSGMYIYQLEIGTKILTRKMTLVK